MIRPTHIPASIVETDTLRMVRQAVQYSLDFRYPVRLIGRPGTGKSCALWHVAEQMGGSYCEIRATTKNTKGMFEDLLRSIGESSGKQHICDIEDLVYRRFMPKPKFTGQEWEDVPCLLFVDEIQTLEATAFRELLRVHERCGLGLVLAGNKERLAGGKKDAETLEQVDGRILPPFHLPGPSKRDCELIGSNYNVEGKDAYSLIVTFGMATNFRALVQLLEVSKGLTGGSVGIRMEHLDSGLRFMKPKPEILKLLNSEAA